MKTPLRYQMTEYDCGPTCLLNAICYLFEREQTPPDIVRSIMVYCLDTFGENGLSGRDGTSRMAMMFLSSWLTAYGATGHLPVKSVYLDGANVIVDHDSALNLALRKGGVAIVRLFYEVGHYVLFTGLQDENILVFDPYLDEESESFPFQTVRDHPFSYNRIVPFDVFNHETHDLYSLGEIPKREAVLIYNTDTMLSEENTVDYYI